MLKRKRMWAMVRNGRRRRKREKEENEKEKEKESKAGKCVCGREEKDTMERDKRL